jgi:glycosyltransferase involved in cell wall biosynthesis
MRLLHVIASMDPKMGGVSQAVRTMIIGLAAQGVHNEVASLDAPSASWHQVDLFPIHTLGPSKGPWVYSPKLIPWLFANFSRFDAIILHGLWLYPGYALQKALRRFKAQFQAKSLDKKILPKLFIMPHGMLDPYFQRATTRRLKAWRNWVYWHMIESAVVNEADGVFFTCETERQLAHEPFASYNPQQEIVVGLGVEEPPHYTIAMRDAFLAKCPELKNRPYFLFLSRIHEKKGVDILLQAYAKVIDLSTESGLVGSLKPETILQEPLRIPVLIIAGPGLETPYGQYIQHLANELPKTTPVFFPGMLIDDAKWGAFYGCEAFVLPSHQENFGIAVVEALACGKPVLISNQVNIWREIEADRSGLVSDDTLPETILMLQRWLQLAKPENRLMAERARQLYEQQYAIEQTAKKIKNAVS